MWDGYSDLDLSMFPPESRLRLPQREYVVLHGALGDYSGWGAFFGGESAWPPAFVWPADHRWCLTKDVDPHWAAVGGSPEAVRSLVQDRRIDAVMGDPSGPTPMFQ